MNYRTIFILVNNKHMLKKMQSLKGSTKLFFTFFLGLLLSVVAVAQDFPAVPNRLVTDYTNTLSSGQQMELEQKLLAFEDSTSIQIAVVVMNSTGDYDIADYGDRLAKQWGVGNRSEEHTSELQSRENLVCRLLLEKKK